MLEAHSHRLKVLYILGSGRCGSTLLDIILGAHPLMKSTGELKKAPLPAWIPGETCSCQVNASLCAFWSAVRRECESRFSFNEYTDGQRRYERLRYLPLTVTAAWVRTDAIQGQAHSMAEMIRVISRQSGKPTIIDSSKDPARGVAYSLCQSEGIDIYYIHLVRDGRGFVWSKKTRPDGEGMGKETKRRSVGNLAFRWMLFNLVSSILFRHRGRGYLRVRYEDLVTRPEETLTRIGEFVGEDMSALITRLERGEDWFADHLIGGNRLRFGNLGALRLDAEWQRGLSRREQAVFWGVAGWLSRIYGYQVRL